MSKSLIRYSLVLGLIAVSAASFGQNATGTSNTSNSRFTGATGNLSNITVSGRTVRWGYDKKNSLEFIPKTFTTVGSNPFKVGSLQWNNYYKDQNGSMNVGLQIGLDYGAKGNGLMALDLTYTESRDSYDRFILPANARLGTATISGQMYNVVVAAYKHASGDGSLDGLKWKNKEKGCDTIDIYAKLEPCAVPEPASMAALGVGIAAIVRRRRNRK